MACTRVYTLEISLYNRERGSLRNIAISTVERAGRRNCELRFRRAQCSCREGGKQARERGSPRAGGWRGRAGEQAEGRLEGGLGLRGAGSDLVGSAVRGSQR
eukprot:COSAG02_NODE_417_length_22746_cov_9.074172_12_plen_102_part_00